MNDLGETVDQEIERQERERFMRMFGTPLVQEDFEYVLNPFKKEEKSKINLLLIC